MGGLTKEIKRIDKQIGRGIGVYAPESSPLPLPKKKPTTTVLPPTTTVLSETLPSPLPKEREALEKERAKRMQKLRRAGRQGTIITQGGLGEPQVKKATLLGVPA